MFVEGNKINLYTYRRFQAGMCLRVTKKFSGIPPPERWVSCSNIYKQLWHFCPWKRVYRSKNLDASRLLAEVTADHTLLAVILADLADRLAGTLVVLVTATDLDSTGARALAVLRSLSRHIGSRSRQRARRALGVPDANLKLERLNI